MAATAFNANYTPGRERWSGSRDLRHLQNAAALVSVQDEEARASLIKTHVGSVDAGFCSKGPPAFPDHPIAYFFNDLADSSGYRSGVSFVRLNARQVRGLQNRRAYGAVINADPTKRNPETCGH
jgi:hypothetical protein